GPRGIGRIRLPPGVERVLGGARAAARHRQADPAAVAAHVPPGQRGPDDRLGPGHGRVHPRRGAAHHLLPCRPGTAHRRARGRGGEGMSDALAVLMPGFVGTTLPAWVRELLEDGLGGVCLFGMNLESPEQVRALTAEIHAANPLAVVAIDEEGGDVSRLYQAV